MMVAACSESTPAERQVREDSIREIMAEDVVKARLRDPESARFEHVRTSRATGLPVVCGTVNAKNGFGGYGGPQPYLVAGEVTIIITEQSSTSEMKQYAELCGIALP